MTDTVLHSSSSVLSLRQGATWLLLSFAAGGVNSVSFIWADRFVTHVTGTVTRLGTHFGTNTVLLESAMLLLAFVLGAMASVVPIQGRVAKGNAPKHAMPLFFVSILITVVALTGHALGDMSEAFEVELLSILAFSMGLMNASVASSTALAVRTTHLTGPASDFGVQLALALFHTGPARRTALKHAALRGGIVAAFGLGAIFLVPVAREVGVIALLIPAALILFATLRSFLPQQSLQKGMDEKTE